MALNLPRLPQTQPTYPQWQAWWEEVASAVETQFNALEDTVAAVAAAQAAADAANTAAATANAAAASAQTTADSITNESTLSGSYVDPTNVLSATDAGADATITVAGHDRKYPQPDGSTITVAVAGGNVTGLAYDTLYYVYYDDAARAGGAVTYAATTTEATAAQQGDRHTVGAIRTPLAAAPPTTGAGTRPPGTRAVDISNL